MKKLILIIVISFIALAYFDRTEKEFQLEIQEARVKSEYDSDVNDESKAHWMKLIQDPLTGKKRWIPKDDSLSKAVKRQLEREERNNF